MLKEETKPKKLLTMKVDEDEKLKWKEMARSHGISLAELIRISLNGQKPKRTKPVPKADPELIRQISAIGNNLNQVSRRVNERERFDVISHLLSIEQQLQELLDAHQVH